MNRSVPSLQKLVIMESLDFFYGDIGPAKTKEIFQLEAVPYSFLVRRVKKETVISYLDAESSIQHQILPVRRDSSLFRHQPTLRGPLEVFNFLRSISSDWLHPIMKTDQIRNQINDSSESWISDMCQICGLVNPPKNHADSHRIVFCQPCNRIVAKGL